MTIKTKISDLIKVAKGLTQSSSVGYLEGVLRAGAQASPFIPTRTLMASTSGSFLFEVGAGKMDAVIHTRLLMQHAADSGRTVAEVAQEYLDLLASLGYSSEPFRRVIAGIAGTSDKAARLNAIPKVTPLFVHEIVERVVPAETSTVLAHMVTDYVCHMLAPLGWIMPDAPLVYEMRRLGHFPRYKDFVDVMEAKTVQRAIQALADADLSLVRSAMEAKTAILPAMTAQHLANAVVTAYEISKTVYDSEAVVRSVLTTVMRVNDCTLPDALQVTDRVRNHPVMAELRSNLAIILAIQDMVSQGVEAEITYADEEMTSVILPLFSQALAEISPYPVRLLDDVVNHIGRRSVKNHIGEPGHIVFFEDWDFSAEVEAFTRIKQTATGPQCFLRPQTNVTSALSSAMKPVRAALSLKQLVDRRLTTYELAASSDRVPVGGAELTLAFPSLLELEIEAGVPQGMFIVGLTSGELPLTDKKGEPIEYSELAKSMFERMRYDYYAMLVHLACAKNGNVTLAKAETPKGKVPYIIWRVRTDLKKPISDSAIEMGEVFTTEPLEVMAYLEDFAPAVAREARVLPVADFASGVHHWNWHNRSIPLGLKPMYMTTVRNESYAVGLDEHELLGLGVRREGVRFIRPLMAVAIARTWLQWTAEDRAYVEGMIQSTKDSLQSEAYRGRQVQSAMLLLALLSSIGSTGVGANASKFVRSRLADEMYKQGNIDDYSALHVGIQKHRLAVWSGLVTLQLLGLITVEDATDLVGYIASTNAMSLIVGTVDMAYMS